MSSHHLKDTVRTCIGCRERAAKTDLLRVVAGDRGQGLEVLPDPAGRAPGRGAHLHPTPECLELAVRRRAFPRALKVPGGMPTTAVEELVASGPQPHHEAPHHRAPQTRNGSSSS